MNVLVAGAAGSLGVVLLKGSEQSTDLIVVLNWYEELKERMDR